MVSVVAVKRAAQHGFNHSNSVDKSTPPRYGFSTDMSCGNGTDSTKQGIKSLQVGSNLLVAEPRLEQNSNLVNDECLDLLLCSARC